MEIIVEEKKEEKPKDVFIEDVPIGYVFQVKEGKNGVIGLKLQSDKIVWLKYSNEDDWFAVWDGSSWNNTPVKIFGELAEIVIKP